MPTLTKRKNKGHYYYYLVESARVNGKPRIVSQKYLGTAENIAKSVEFMSKGGIPEPEFSKVYEFGAVSALFDLAERLGIGEIIERHTGKRKQGLSVADTVVLAAVNRAAEPVSKNGFYRWFERTVLSDRIEKANEKSLSSQGFWNNMNALSAEGMRAAEDDIIKEIVSRYDIATDCLLFDNTNFFTYIDTATPGVLARRGKSKEHRTDLRIIGLSMMVSPDHNIPLFHEAYCGNMNDAKRFSEVVGDLKARYEKLGKGRCTPTLVFDRGNNSEENIRKVLSANPREYNFVGGLRFNQCPELTSLPKTEYRALEGERLKGYTAARTKKEIYGAELTVVITYNPELFKAQADGVGDNIAKCAEKLEALRAVLSARASGIVTKGKKPTVESVKKKIAGILSAEHMKTLFDCEVFEEEGHVNLSYCPDESKLEDFKENVLGKSILFSDHHEWETEKIVSAYHSQYHVEQCFRQMKDTKYPAFRPQFHFTDAHIKVHAFYCVLALTLCGVLQKETEMLGHKMSIHRMLDTLGDVKQVITVFPKIGNRQVVKSSFSGLDGIAKEYIDRYDLTKYAVKL
ncbi:MAG: IS1634 family transposase [Proteiniphilum sp.]|jgi:transposase|nr:IS1634 family transposase [Proteiniphilum sp.]